MAPRTTKHTPVFRTSYMEVSKLKYPNIQPRNDWDLALLASFTGSPSLTSNEKFYAYSDDEMRAQYHNLGLTDKEIKDGRARAEVIKQATEILDSPGTAVGLKPRPGDDDVHIRAIPNSDYSIRMWGTNMETNREYCFDFVETATEDTMVTVSFSTASFTGIQLWLRTEGYPTRCRSFTSRHPSGRGLLTYPTSTSWISGFPRESVAGFVSAATPEGSNCDIHLQTTVPELP
ncbi:hypothetical protein Agabi119p4_5860 [Agaricus bisporus var. burnettii]|uniref:Uncharacterized protein n=1 Tax=Agaricus bisporus var. burnettii TaxID=192524 RepID=A0A8H7F2I3_AGABI|nr:hypothetical protein Agabi119p4_5860 [Agaricus bisporus var. burnettii]